MKKQDLKNLKLNKKSISNFNQSKIVGAAPNTKTYCNCGQAPDHPLTIETICWGPSGMMQCGGSY
ncbi:hypothetical protein [uncultured Kordia sp.]|uniref:hypothetical protein n=1 Tax=uncultured Kordia sp. TaxID=507699 RepID=UPI00260608F1|nr:hypothetical protein [uncultured Kordia sp.]